jgi:regulator of sigma E protease
VSWVLVILGFCFLIVLHEAGHFVAAKAVGMRVERFFLFFPPKLVSKRIGETEYGIGMIPLGGFVKITGMNPEELKQRREGEDDHEEEDRTPQGLLTRIEGADSGPETPAGGGGSQPLPPDVLARAYYNQPVWKRIVVIAAGPAVNIALAFVILFLLAFGVRDVNNSVGQVDPGSPAAAAHLKSGDKIVAVDSRRFASLGIEDRLNHFRDIVASHKCPGKQTAGCRAATPVTLTIKRNGGLRTVTIYPRYDPAVGRTRIGFSYGTTPANPDVGGAARRAGSFMWLVTSKTVGVIGRIFEPQQRKQVSGIVGVSDVAHQTIGFGAREALTLLAIVSLSLGVINLFPFLPLDGGHIFWSLVEKVRGSPVPFSVMERAGAIGFVLVIMLFVIGLTNDIGRLTGQGFNVR